MQGDGQINQIPDVIYTPDGRVLLMGMDPTLTLCPACGEVISEDYYIINVQMELGTLAHVRCLPGDGYFEEQLLGVHDVE